MGHAAKTHTITHCPFCGSNVVTHLHNDIFVCGLASVEEEAQAKAAYQGARCNRSFRVMLNHLKPVVDGLMAGEFRRAVGERRKAIGVIDRSEEDLQH